MKKNIEPQSKEYPFLIPDRNMSIRDLRNDVFWSVSRTSLMKIGDSMVYVPSSHISESGLEYSLQIEPMDIIGNSLKDPLLSKPGSQRGKNVLFSCTKFSGFSLTVFQTMISELSHKSQRPLESESWYDPIT